MVDLKNIFPRIKSVINSTDGENFTLSNEDSPVLKSLAEDLYVAYALDEGSVFKFIQNRDLNDSITIDTLHQAAVNNMSNLVRENTQIQGDIEKIVMVVNGGDFEATMLIADSFWDSFENQFMKQGYYVAVPAVDLLYIAPKTSPNAIEHLETLIKSFFDDPNPAPGLLVKHIYERVGNNWVVYKTV